MTGTLLISIEDGLARLTLNRPARLNAFNAELAREFTSAALEVTSRDDVGAVLIDATGPAFCAGGDVVEMGSSMGSGRDISALADVINAGIRALVESTVPVAAAAHGTTAGGGLGILLASDYAVVGANSKVGCIYAKVGLTPDLSVTAHLADAVGQRRALQLVLSDRMLHAPEALDWGLVAEVVSPGPDEQLSATALADRVRARAEAVARTWVDGPTHAFGQAKRLIRSQPSRSFHDQLADEARTIGTAFETDEARARIEAFTAGRKA